MGHIHRNTNGYHNPQNFITTITLNRDGLDTNLPRAS